MRMDGEMEGERDSVEREREREILDAGRDRVWAYGGWLVLQKHEGCL